MAGKRSIESLVSRRDGLVSRPSGFSEAVRGSISSVCAKCQRAGCKCESKTSRRSYRLTYKDKNQKTQIVYMPKDRLADVRRLIRNHAKMRKIVSDIVALNIEILKIR